MNETAEAGIFELQDNVLSQYADNCVNTVKETSKMEKEAISVFWLSPPEGNGCIFLR